MWSAAMLTGDAFRAPRLLMTVFRDRMIEKWTD
jgi:hypothetical protein